MSNILDLSIHNVKLAKRLKDIDTEAVIPYSNIDFKESGKSVGVFTAITKKISNGAFGKLKFSPNAEKKMTKTGQYVTYFNVIYGTLLFKIEGEKKGALVKTGFSFQVNQDTNYSISNLRNDESIVDFTIIKDSP